MSRDVITLSPQDKIESALKLLNEHRIRHIPITNDEEQVVGIVSDRDIRDAAPSILAAEQNLDILESPIQPLSRVLLLPHILLISLKILLHYSMITKLRVCLLRMQINSLVSSRRKIFSTH